AVAVTGIGVAGQPWTVIIYRDQNIGDAALQVWVENDAGFPQISFALDLIPRAIVLDAAANAADNVTLTLHTRAQVVRFDLPPNNNCDAPISARWFPALLAEAII